MLPGGVCYMFFFLLLQLIPCWWVLLEEVLDEEVVALVLAEAFAHCVACAWEEDELEVFACALEGVNDLVRRRRVDVVVHLAYYEHELTFEVLGVLDV